jgi:hypothetical protein
MPCLAFSRACRYKEKNRKLIELNEARQREERDQLQRSLAEQKKEKERKYKEMSVG